MIDKKVDPCDDFSSYICGNMEKIFSIPPGGISFDAAVEIDTEVIKQIKFLLEDKTITNNNKFQSNSAIFYRSCLNMTSRDNKSKFFINEFVNNFLLNENYEKGLIRILKLNMETSLISLNVQQDPANPEYKLLSIGKPSFILSETTLQSHNSKGGKKILALYQEFMNNILNILDIWKNEKSIIDGIINLHISLAKELPSVANQNNQDKINNKIKIKDIQILCPQLSWITVLNGILEGSGKVLKENDDILVFSLEYIEVVCKIIKTYRNDSSKNKILLMDLAWSFINRMIPLGSKIMIETSDNFQSEIFGVTGNEDLWKTCVDLTSKTLKEIVGSMYVKANFKPHQKEDIEFLIFNIKEALKLVMEQATWMDDETKQTALLKLKAMKSKIGYPDSLISETYLKERYGELQIVSNSLMENYKKIQEIMFINQMKTIGEKISDDEWTMGPQEINAYYNPNSNEIVFPAAILHYPFYDVDLPFTYNYGAIGSVVGHEILHGFDVEGSKFDSNGRLKQWWSKASRQAYLEKVQCIIDQYGKYTLYDEFLPSVQTVGEDTADNAGIRMSYIAMNSKYEKREKFILPELNFTADQLFFVSEARIWCTLIDKDVQLDIKEDVHSVWKYRINGPLSNMPEFSKAFNCTRNKEMNRLKKCLVW